MKKFFEQSNVLYALVAFFFACTLWAFVVYTENPTTEKEFVGPVVTLEGLETLEARNLIVTAGDDSRVSIKIEGLYSQMAYFDTSRVTASTDLSYIKEAGTYQISNNNISIYLPETSNNVSTKNISLMSVNPSSIEIEVQNIVEMEIPVVAEVTGEPASGYLYQEPTLSQPTITVEGAQSYVEEIAYAVFPMTADGLDVAHRFTGDVMFYNAADELLTKDFLFYDTADLEVILPVDKIVSVPLTVSIDDSSSLTESMVQVRVSPETIRIVGTETLVDGIESINLGTIDLDDVSLKAERSFTIEAPENTYLYDEIAYATVTVEVLNVVERDIYSDTFTITDTNVSDDLLITAQVDEVAIKVRGEATAVNNIAKEDLRIQVTVNSALLGEGTHVVEGSVQLLVDGHFYLMEDIIELEITIAPVDEALEETENEAESQDAQNAGGEQTEAQESVTDEIPLEEEA